MNVVGQGHALLQISKLSVRYVTDGAAVRAVRGASLSIMAGECVGLLGESGCGKSTLARAVLGLLPASARLEGSIRFQDLEITSAPASSLRSLRGAQVSLVSQDPAQALNPVLTVGAQVAEVLRSHVPVTGAERKTRVIETLRSVGFAAPERISRRYPHQLSGGERQRVAIAQAIVCRPALVIADEATSKLDVTLKSELLDLFSALREQYGMALLLISHEPSVVAKAADRLLVMYAGEIVEAGPTVSLLRNPLHPYTQALVRLARERAWSSSIPRARFTPIPGEPASPKNDDCCYFEPRCGQSMAICAARHPAARRQDGREVQCILYE